MGWSTGRFDAIVPTQHVKPCGFRARKKRGANPLPLCPRFSRRAGGITELGYRVQLASAPPPNNQTSEQVKNTSHIQLPTKHFTSTCQLVSLNAGLFTYSSNVRWGQFWRIVARRPVIYWMRFFTTQATHPIVWDSTLQEYQAVPALTGTESRIQCVIAFLLVIPAST